MGTILEAIVLFLFLVGGFAVVAMAHRRKTPLERAASNPVRRRLLEAIGRRPGEALNELWKEIGTSRGAASYHLSILERIGAVKSVRSPHSTRYFPPGAKPGELLALALLLRGRVMEVAWAVLQAPGIAQRDLTGQVEISRRVFREYADLLIGEELLREERQSRTKRYFPTPRLREAYKALSSGRGGANAGNPEMGGTAREGP